MIKRFAFSICAIALGVLLALSVLEAGLRLAGWHETRGQENRITTAQPPLPGEYRIICLGESTTVQTYSNNQNIAWPKKLERKHNSLGLGKTFRTITIAKHGTSTPFLIRDLERRIDEIKPDLVVSMMGINDISTLSYFQRSDWLSTLRTVKLTRWLTQSLKQLVIPHVTEPEGRRIEIAIMQLPPRAIVKNSLEVPQIQSENDLTTYVQNVEAYAHSLPRRHTFFAYQVAAIALLNLRGIAEVDPNLKPFLPSIAERTIEMSRKSIAHNPYSTSALRFFIYAAVNRPDLNAEIIKHIHNAIDHGGNLDSALLSLIGIYRDDRIQNELKEVGIATDTNATPLSKTRENYLYLARMLKQMGVPYMVMQYPNASINGMQSIFSNAEIPYATFSDLLEDSSFNPPVSPEFANILFVSNENFRSIVTPENEAEYFKDMFHNGPLLHFGHTTEKGHELIADNVVHVLTGNWNYLNSKTERAR